MNEQKALADRTLFAFIGDHGEAFGGRHKGNVLHRNNLYEENIRLSFMLAQPCFKHPEKAMRVVDHRPASNINVALTLLRAAGDTAANRSLVDDHDFQPGLDLLARQNDDTGNLAFFVKRANQGRAGVIDGDWKFTMLIDEPIDELQQGGILDAQSFDELYYLADDPQEKVNLLAGGNVKDDLVQQRGRRYAALVELWYGMADCVYQEQFSSLTMHPFCRTVHLYRGVEGRLREVTRVERVDDGIRILFDDSSILRRRGLVHVTDVGQCGDAVCEPLSAAVMVANQDFSKADQCGNSDMKAVFEVAAEQVDVFVRVPQRLQSDTLSVRVFDLLGAQVALLADCFITFPES